MKKRFFIAMSIVAIVAGATAEGEHDFAPKWNIGDRWTVRGWDGLVTPNPTNRMERIVIRKGKPFDVTCEVTRVVLVGTQACFEVTAKRSKKENEIIPDEKWIAYYTTNEMALIKLVSIIHEDPSSHVDYKFDYKRGCPTTAEDLPSVIPFDTPSFVNTTRAMGRTRLGREIVQETTAKENAPERFTTKLRTQYMFKERVVKQEWEKGLPWWRSWVETRGGEVHREFELVIPEKPKISE